MKTSFFFFEPGLSHEDRPAIQNLYGSDLQAEELVFPIR